MGQKIKKMDFSQINYTPMEGELMQNAEDGHYYVWHDGEWCAVKMDNSGFEMGIYDMNKQIISQMPNLTDWDRVLLYALRQRDFLFYRVPCKRKFCLWS